jgi:hypothetical protein
MVYWRRFKRSRAGYTRFYSAIWPWTRESWSWQLIFRTAAATGRGVERRDFLIRTMRPRRLQCSHLIAKIHGDWLASNFWLLCPIDGRRWCFDRYVSIATKLSRSSRGRR